MPHKKAYRLFQSIEHGHPGAPPIYGNKIENEWAIGLSSCLYSKTKKLNREDFTKFDQNWLLVYDNLTSALFDYDVSVNRLLQTFGLLD